jgi:hypothetical protein
MRSGVFRSAHRAAILRLASLIWSAILITLMATGTYSTARIGAMTWGPVHDIWDATIAISQIKFGLSGKLGYHEIEEAIANDLIVSGSTWNTMDEINPELLQSPTIVTRAFVDGASLKKDGIKIPAGKEGYLTDWCEDLGYADFYNIAFRLFGFTAYSTHYLYFTVLILSFLLFAGAFWRENLAILSLTVSLTALFLVSTSSFFSLDVPSFAANRFLSTLALIPMLHAVHTTLRLRRLGLLEIALLAVQSVLMAFAIAARSSAQWAVIAVLVTGLFIVFWRRPRSEIRGRVWRRLAAFARNVRRVPYLVRVVAAPATVVAIVLAAGAWRTANIDDRYFWEDNYPHHLVWHSAYVALSLNPDWAKVKPYPDVPDGGDGVGFKVFEHYQIEHGLPFASKYNAHYYIARLYEPFIGRQYIDFALNHPGYIVKLFGYYKTVAFTSAVKRLTASILASPYHYQILIIFVISIIFSNFIVRGAAKEATEFIASCVVIFLSSLLPVYWAYSGSTLGEQFWAVLFLAMVVFIKATSVLVRRTPIGASPRRAIVSLIALPVLVVLAIAWGLPPASLAASPVAPGIRVFEAMADDNCEGQRHDATQLVRSACTGREKCAYPVEARNASGPAGACAQELTVSYICFPGGTRHVAQLSDEGGAGGNVDLSCDRPLAAADAVSGSGIQIRSATYGASCAVAPGNATLDLRRACAGRADCDYFVDVERLHDPAPGCGKDFNVDYACAPDATPLHKELPAEAGLGSHLRLICQP